MVSVNLMELKMLVVYGNTMPMYMEEIIVVGIANPALREIPLPMEHLLLPICISEIVLNCPFF
jgi:hypothetical protein